MAEEAPAPVQERTPYPLRNTEKPLTTAVIAARAIPHSRVFGIRTCWRITTSLVVVKPFTSVVPERRRPGEVFRPPGQLPVSLLPGEGRVRGYWPEE